jgi:putative ABC transport system permease protein
MFGLVGCVLLIACANVANLVVGRAVARQREMAVRLAIGAGRWRLMRQILTENLVLFLMAGAASVLFAVWGVRWIDHAIEASIPQASRAFLPNFGSVAVEWPALLYTLAIAIVAGLVFGFAPAFQVRRTDVNHGLKESARSSSGSRGIRLKNALIVAELSLALVVLVASGLLVKGLVRMYASDTGFQPNGLVTTYITLSDAKYADLQRAESFFRESLEKLRSLAGVTAASMGWSVPYSGNESMTRYAVEGRALPPPTEAPSTMFQAVSPDYFATMGIPLLTGRMLSEQDKSDSLPVVLINQTMAKLHWPGGDPVGQRLRYGQLLGRSVTIAGVVRDTNGMNEHDLPAPMLFFPYPQLPSRGMTVILRSALPLSTLAAAVRGVVKSVDANQPIAELETIDQLIDIQRAPSRIIVQATSFFAALSLFLAAMGTYAVMAYAVAARRQEFGIRMALGAARRDLLSLVLGQGLKLAAGGLLVGLAASYGVMRLLGFMFYHVSPSDPPTFLGITILLLAVAALACYLPARRASTIDPTTALRYE